MNNVESLKANFPEAINVRRYLTRVREVIEPLGFDRSNTFTMTSLCRDELAQAFVDEVTGFWQRPFDLNGLGGLPSGGIETWQAALGNANHGRGRPNLLVIGMSHIGIGPDGELGRILRNGHDKPTMVCRALGSILDEITAAVEGTGSIAEPADSEAGRLKRVILNSLGSDSAPDLRNAFLTMAGLINDSIWESLEDLSAHTTADVVVCTGVQIHMHDDLDHIVPVASTFQGSDAKLTALHLR